VQQILSNTHHRRTFIGLVGCLFIAAALVRYLLLPKFDPTLQLHGLEVIASLIDKLLSSLIITVLIGVIVFWLEPKASREADMSKIEPKQIPILLRDAIPKTERWSFRGGTGRYTRAVTLPTMAEYTRSTRSTKELHIQLINPIDVKLCEKYADYKRSLQGENKNADPWTMTRVRTEIYATILKAIWTVYEFPLLRLQVTLLNSFSSFRLDLSSEYVILTQEDARAFGLKCDKGTYFYEAYRDDLVLTASQGKKLTFSRDPLQFSLASARAHLTEMALIDDLTDELLQSAIGLAEVSKNPYA
jgi:hypothetical protein